MIPLITTMASVQFFGIESLLETYDNCKVPAWGLFCARQIICSYEENDLEAGAQLLQQFLEAIEKSPATYTLKLYKQRNRNEIIINEKTACDLSFNFKLSNEYHPFTRPTGRGLQVQRNGRFSPEEIEQLKEAIGITDEIPERKSIGEIIGDALTNPEELNKWIGTIRDIKNLLAPQPYGPAQIANVTFPAATAKLPPRSTEKTNEPMTDAEREALAVRLGAAIDILEKNDPKIVEHLEKLAIVSQDNKTMFNFLLKSLENL